MALVLTAAWCCMSEALLRQDISRRDVTLFIDGRRPGEAYYNCGAGKVVSSGTKGWGAQGPGSGVADFAPGVYIVGPVFFVVAIAGVAVRFVEPRCVEKLRFSRFPPPSTGHFVSTGGPEHFYLLLCLPTACL